MNGDFQHLATGRLGLQVQLGPQDRRHLSIVGSLGADLDLIFGDVVVQTGQELLWEIVAAIDATVVADEFIACHLLWHLLLWHLQVRFGRRVQH